MTCIGTFRTIITDRFKERLAINTLNVIQAFAEVDLIENDPRYSPKYTLHEERSGYVKAYNDAHNRSVEAGNCETVESFNAAAFAVAGNVHVDCQSKDWLLGEPAPPVYNVAKMRSTLIHEYIHAISNAGCGLQILNQEEKFSLPEGTTYIDEAITDLIAVAVYSRMGFGEFANYFTGYVLANDSGRTGRMWGANGTWLSSLILASPFTNAIRKELFNAYFHGNEIGDHLVDAKQAFANIKNVNGFSSKPLKKELIENKIFEFATIANSALPLNIIEHVLTIMYAPKFIPKYNVGDNPIFALG
jgi:hypothetical protein